MTVLPTSSAPLRGWRALPPPLALALCMSLISAVANALNVGGLHTATMSEALGSGMIVATRVLEIYGLAVLARRHTGSTRFGLYLLLGTSAYSLLAWLLWQPVMLNRGDLHGWIGYFQMSWGLCMLLNAVGLVVAAWRTGRGGRVLVAAIGTLLLPSLASVLVSSASFSLVHALTIAGLVSAIGYLGLLAWVMTLVAGEAPPPSTSQIASGLRHAGHALRLIVVLVMCTLLLSIAPGGVHTSNALVSFVYIAGLWLGALAIGWLGVSLARAAVTPGAEPGAYLLGIAGLLVLVCGGGMLFGALMQTARWLGDEDLSSAVTRSTAAVVLLAPLGGTVLAAAIARFGGRSGFDALRRRATAVAIGLGALSVPGWFASDELVDMSPKLAILAASLVLAAGLVLAILCKAAAQALEHGHGDIPIARVV